MVMMTAERAADQLKAAMALLGEARRLHQLMDVDAKLKDILRLLDDQDDDDQDDDEEGARDEQVLS